MRSLKKIYREFRDGEQIEVAFLFQAGTVWASMESVYKSCMADERFHIELILMEETTVETAHMVGAKEFLQQENLTYIPYGEIDWQIYCPHIIFIQFPYDTAFHTPETLSIQFQSRGIRIVYIPYGIEISDTEMARKDHFQSYVVENSWRIYTCCEGIGKEYRKYCRNRQAVRVCGSPKFDAVADKMRLSICRAVIEKSRGRKLIVWKIHFPKKIIQNGEIKQITPCLQEYLQFAELLYQYQDFFFIILAHPKMQNGMVSSDIQGDKELIRNTQKLMECLETQDNVYIDTSADYRNSFYHADAIIMDRSAVIIEAAMLQVPVLFMKPKDYFETMTLPVQEVVGSFYQGTSCKDMQDFIRLVKSGVDPKGRLRKEAVETYFPFSDGLCGERIKEDLVSALTEKRSDKLQVAIYGTGEICKYYIEKQNWSNRKEFKLTAIVDSSEVKWGTEFYGYKIQHPEILLEEDYDAVVVMTEAHYFDIKKKLVYEFYIDERKIWRLDEFILAIGQSDFPINHKGGVLL